ncbi:MAG TPA: hypothetical protein VFA74_09150 [Terriglobales bacterium]|nr:hypothetical protein [Terriglobales bacterium]
MSTEAMSEMISAMRQEAEDYTSILNFRFAVFCQSDGQITPDQQRDFNTLVLELATLMQTIHNDERLAATAGIKLKAWRSRRSIQALVIKHMLPEAVSFSPDQMSFNQDDVVLARSMGILLDLNTDEM